ncbi:MAG: hypothetical protein ABGZ53_22580 [Fuerstiella sp.]
MATPGIRPVGTNADIHRIFIQTFIEPPTLYIIDRSSMMSKLNRFVLLCHQRSGSNALSTVLHQHPDIAIFGQLFKDHPTSRPALRSLGLPMFKRCPTYNYLTNSRCETGTALAELRLRLYRRSSDVRDYVDCFYERFHAKTGNPVVGYKLHAHQLSNEDFETALTERTDKVILLHRRNLLAAAVSWCVAVHTSQWVTTSKRRVKSLAGVSIDVDEARWFIRQTRHQTDQWRSMLKRNNVEYREFVYEDLFNECTLSDVWDFLEVKRLADAQPRTRRLMTKDRYQEIVNLDEVNRTLASDENGCLRVA